MQKISQDLRYWPTIQNHILHYFFIKIISRYHINSASIERMTEKELNIPSACNSSREKQLPTDSGRDFNLFFDTFNSTNCIKNPYKIMRNNDASYSKKKEVKMKLSLVHFLFTFTFFIFITTILNLSLLYGVKATWLSSFILFYWAASSIKFLLVSWSLTFYLTGSSLVIGASNGLHYRICSLPSKPTFSLP